jgi:AraC-like DNA-binding protein
MNEIEHRYVIKFLCAKKFALNRTEAELVSVPGEQAYEKKAVEYWTHQIKMGQSDMEDEAKHIRPPLGDVDARILACLSHESFSSIRSIAQALGLAPATLHRHLVMSLGTRPQHFRWSSKC